MSRSYCQKVPVLNQSHRGWIVSGKYRFLGSTVYLCFLQLAAYNSAPLDPAKRLKSLFIGCTYTCTVTHTHACASDQFFSNQEHLRPPEVNSNPSWLARAWKSDLKGKVYPTLCIALMINPSLCCNCVCNTVVLQKTDHNFSWKKLVRGSCPSCIDCKTYPYSARLMYEKE